MEFRDREALSNKNRRGLRQIGLSGRRGPEAQMIAAAAR
jgi:hypothetical protein